MSKEELYGWVFTYNPYIGKYMAVERENYNELWNGDKGNVVYGNTSQEVEELIIKKEEYVTESVTKSI